MLRDAVLQERARAVVDGNHYLTLGTTEPDHRPRLSPVYFTHAGYRTFYWVSSPSARHSRNIASRSAVALVVFDSTAAVGHGSALYVGGDASLVADEDLPVHCAAAFAEVRSGARAFAPHELSGEASLRLYRAEATSWEVHVRGGDPDYGTGIDRRVEVSL
jgi:hypothetical protein